MECLEGQYIAYINGMLMMKRYIKYTLLLLDILRY